MRSSGLDAVHHVLERGEAGAHTRVSEDTLRVDLVFEVRGSDGGRSAWDQAVLLLPLDSLPAAHTHRVRGLSRDVFASNDTADDGVVEAHALSAIAAVRSLDLARRESLRGERRRRDLMDGQAHIHAPVGGACKADARSAGARSDSRSGAHGESRSGTSQGARGGVGAATAGSAETSDHLETLLDRSESLLGCVAEQDTPANLVG